MMVMASTQTLSHCSLHRNAPIFRLPSFKPGGFWKVLTEAFCTLGREWGFTYVDKEVENRLCRIRSDLPG
ncbi:hypothetical protein SAMN05216404_103167 [Nitrosospira multiformis]|uniref:Uncharacterized protein n=1 Tax=Nitrosospira multiformis TaxID=1231 RepID=A0A1H8EVY9_9PROT|nr:hypothetical protein SAMN05216404_103167 [Nitrosospira multiformis]